MRRGKLFVLYFFCNFFLTKLWQKLYFLDFVIFLTPLVQGRAVLTPWRQRPQATPSRDHRNSYFQGAALSVHGLRVGI